MMLDIVSTLLMDHGYRRTLSANMDVDYNPIMNRGSKLMYENKHNIRT
jgi:hypothetical protein